MAGRDAVSMWRRAWRICVLSAVAALSCAIAVCQTTQAGTAQGAIRITANKDGGVPTLHVYADLIELPVLVLGRGWQPVPPIAADRFRVSIDGGPEYRVRQVRLEGDDPIELAILLDLRGSQDGLLTTMDDAVAKLAPGWLHAGDHVSVYGLDCGLMRSLNDGAADPATLRHAVDALLDARRLRKMDERGRSDRRECSDRQHLWDALGVVVVDMSKMPGRRVVLAVTDGLDKGSRNKWQSIGEFAQVHGVTVFGLSYAPFIAPITAQMYDPELDGLCTMSGGMLMTGKPIDLDSDLQRFTKLVRGRYIVEFPRPFNATSGRHRLKVSITKSDAVIRWAGISVPVEDPAVMRDPTTVHGDPSLAPVQGNKPPKPSR